MINIREMPCISYNYHQWYKYLKDNDKQRLIIDFSSEPLLNKAERKLIFPSIKAFQIGEHSDGTILLKAVSKFAAQIDEPTYKNVMASFIKEENFHSYYLAQYMNYHKEPLRKSTFLDRIFRKIRQAGGIFLEISVLETAEIIALSYYSALANTAKKLNSAALVSICEQMLNDELRHIVLQSYTISRMKINWFKCLFRKLLMKLTTDAVWIAYHHLLKSGNYSYSHFRKENLGYLNQSMYLSALMQN
ncbi:MAG: hypothetical protein IJT38_03950 [Clostridia bacterium]|nr:hypothetical protein [Clostridia bacterium]